MNIKFNHWNHGMVKLKMKPGQEIRHVKRWHNGEGWSYSEHIYEYDGEYLELTSTYGGTDCDGYGSREFKALVKIGPDWRYEEGFPQWGRILKREYDETAESMGY